MNEFYRPTPEEMGIKEKGPKIDTNKHGDEQVEVVIEPENRREISRDDVRLEAGAFLAKLHAKDPKMRKTLDQLTAAEYQKEKNSGGNIRKTR